MSNPTTVDAFTTLESQPGVERILELENLVASATAVRIRLRRDERYGWAGRERVGKVITIYAVENAFNADQLENNGHYYCCLVPKPAPVKHKNFHIYFVRPVAVVP